MINAMANDVVIFTRGTKGDLYPFLRLAQGLKGQGCSVTLMSNYCYEAYAAEVGLNFVELDDRESFENLNNVPEYHTNLPALLGMYRDHILSKLNGEVKLIGDVVKANSVLLAHSNDYLSPLFAMEKYGTPLYICMLAPSYAHGLVLFEAVLNSLTDELNKLRENIGLPRVEDWKTWLMKFEHCFALWPKWYSDEARNIVPRLDYLGFVSIESVEHAAIQQPIKDFLFDKCAPVVLVTHGTSKPFNDQYFKLCLSACEILGYKVIVSTPFPHLLPDPLPNNALWVDFCPFHLLLPFVDLIIHHGGIGTVRESIWHCTPQLIIGQGFDRQHNGRAVKKLGVGDWLAPNLLSINSICEKIGYIKSTHQIESQCRFYRSQLYDDQALNNFYKDLSSVSSHKAEQYLCLDSKSTNVESENEPSMNIYKNHIQDTPSDFRHALLAKLLKNKIESL